VHVALFAYFVQANFIAQPYWDMLSIVTRYLQFERDGNLWSYLWEPHVQHRQVWMRLLTALDADAFGGVAYPFVVSAVACMGLAAWLLWRFVGRHHPGDHGAWLGTLVVMLVMTSVAAVDCAIPMNAIYPQAFFFAVVAVLCLASDEEASSWRPWAAAGAAVCAAFGNAAALALWPILAWLAWQSRRRLASALFVAGGVAFAVAYLYRMPSAGEVGAGLTLDRLPRVADYLITYLGLPWTRSAALVLPGKLVGAVLGLGAVGAGAWGLVRRLPVVDRAGVALMLFSLATAVLASIGRSDVDADLRVPVRYAVFVAPLHVGVLFIAWRRLVEWLRPDRAHLLQPLAIGLALVLVVQQVAAGQAAARTTAAMRSTLARFAAGEETDDMRAVVFVDLTQARRDLSAIHAAGLYRPVR